MFVFPINRSLFCAINYNMILTSRLRLFELLNERPGGLSSMPWRLKTIRGSAVFLANRVFGVPSCPAPLRPAASLRPAAPRQCSIHTNSTNSAGYNLQRVRGMPLSLQPENESLLLFLESAMRMNHDSIISGQMATVCQEDGRCYFTFNIRTGRQYRKSLSASLSKASSTAPLNNINVNNTCC